MFFEDLNIARIDLVFDNKKMIELLEGRGNALKLQDYDQLIKYEDQIEALKHFQYFADVVGAFITYERNQDLQKIQ